MRARSLPSLGSTLVFVIACLLPINVLAQQASNEKGAGQAESRAKDDSGDHPSGSPKSVDRASDGQVNVTVTPQNGERAEAAPLPKGLGWIPWLTSVVFSWPFLAAALVIYLLRNPQLIKSTLILFQSFKIFGAEFILDRRSGLTAEAAIEVYRDEVKEKFDAIVQDEDIIKKHKAIVNKLLEKPGGVLKDVVDLRSTIYVPDLLFYEGLYQLLDYYPTTAEGGKKGRVFSARYGMIGRCWRSEESVVQGSVPTDNAELISLWGMDKGEAALAAKGRKSFACVILKNADHVPLGLFYMDSRPPSAFDSPKWEQLWATVTDEARSELIPALQKVYTELILRSARVKIYKR